MLAEWDLKEGSAVFAASRYLRVLASSEAVTELEKNESSKGEVADALWWWECEDELAGGGGALLKGLLDENAGCCWLRTGGGGGG